MTGYFLGIDIGGTKSHALVVDRSGQALAAVASPIRNPKPVIRPIAALSLANPQHRKWRLANLWKDNYQA